jgi:transcriptional regulator with XRE-family HTH domain
MTPQQAQRLGKFLRNAREDAGLSLADLAEQTGLSKATIGRIEQGLILATRAEKLKAIAKGLDLPVADVLLMADYSDPADLPSVPVYMRARYSGELSAKDLRDIEAFINERRASGTASRGPKKGEDER